MAVTFAGAGSVFPVSVKGAGGRWPRPQVLGPKGWALETNEYILTTCTGNQLILFTVFKVSLLC